MTKLVNENLLNITTPHKATGLVTFPPNGVFLCHSSYSLPLPTKKGTVNQSDKNGYQTPILRATPRATAVPISETTRTLTYHVGVLVKPVNNRQL